MKLIRILIISPPTVNEINKFRYFNKQTGDFNYEKYPVCLLLVFLIFYHISLLLFHIGKILGVSYWNQ